MAIPNPSTIIEMKPAPAKTLGPLLLSGMMIGPILGSGIIILPPLAYGVAGDWAIFAWALMAVAGFFFAFTFARLSILHPGSGGVTTAIAMAFGPATKRLTSLYLIGAVFFGPVAVMLTAADYLFPDRSTAPLLALPMLLACSWLLQRKIDSIGKVSLVVSSLAAAILVAGGTTTLLFHHKPAMDLTPFAAGDFGYTLLLLFWSIVGWEVVGNYSGEVRDPQKTITRAVGFSAAVVTVVSLVVGAAIQFADPALTGGGKLQVSAIIAPLFAGYSKPVMALLTLSLCTATYLLFVGAVARLIGSMAKEKYLPGILGATNRCGAPVGAIALLTAIHLAVLGAAAFGIVDTEILVALADGFFIANAFIGIAAAGKLFPGRLQRTCTLLLGLFFIIIFLHSHILVILLILAMAAGTLARAKVVDTTTQAG